ncbi:MAG: transglycosylase domain-containing protein [Lachnospiraceae bacterium]|nr:transglycosylase domain-containing protein [Lachnospiraceae bacterium]MCM1238255.1 transglycosylase domain-containing protein [Lachnospiraceae bacterium]MCM1343666.1 transglycosylase domain-containing protein [Muribaculaceae bacterium]MCM1410303.1 transglycosylase domain-containing protein [Lachnospiraceae bacterium]
MNYGRRGVRAKQKALNSKTIKWERKLILSLFELVLIAMVGLGICGVAAGIGAFKGILSSTPSIHFNDIVASGQATIVYDMEGNEIDQYVNTDSNRIRVEMAAIPEHLGQAFIALEDRRFYQHNGIDFKGMIRAGYTFLQTGGNRAEGASTITQQLLKNTVFTEWMEEGDNMIKKIKRKIQEQFLAIEISKVYSKDQILLEYMNAINLGQNTLGVESASQRYFGKTCSELTLSECAVIASITQNPSRYNPISHPDRNRDRRQKCLDDMLELEFITQAEYDEAIADTDAVYERIGLFDTDYRLNSNATAGSYFSDAVYEQVKEDLINIAGYSESMTERLLTAGGLRIYSTMDPTIQAIADEEFANPDNFPPNVKWYLSYALTIRDADDTAHNFSKENMMTWFKANVDKKFNLIFSSQDEAYEAIEAYRTAMLAELGVADDEDNYDESVSMTAQPQAAFVIEDQETGYVVALVGGRGAKEGRRTLNRATSAMRSPGSTFKVLASFAPALDSAGKTLATVYNDAPFNYDDGKPVSNWYKTGYRGIQSIREATRESLNIIAVKNLTVITPQLGYDYLLNFGFTTVTDHYVASNGDILSDVNQSLALGGLTLGVTPYELNAGYATIANMGTYVEPKLYTKVTDSEGNVILDNTTPTTRQVIKETTAFLLTDAMVDVVKNGGTGARCNFSQSMAIAGKTGTSTDTHDVWFCGYTPYYTASVWTGYDNNIGMSTSKANDESAVSKVLWRAIMQRVHENLPPESFTRPAEGIVQVDICTQSGQLPVPGLCDGCIRSELFAEGTEPTTTCTIHYQGDICAYQGIPASPECPFKYTGVATFPLAEDPALINGSTTIIENPDGTQTVNTPSRTSERCQHDAAFYANPEWESIIAAQQWELEQRGWAAQSEEDDWEEDE